MAIVPSGKMRIMQAQSYSDPFYSSEIESPPGSLQSSDPLSSIEQGNVVGDTEMLTYDDAEKMIQEDTEDQKDISEDSKTLSDFIFNKLEEFGYPPRRLYEFKEDFISQEISADGTENVTVVIPDKKYPDPNTGAAPSIEKKDITKISSEMGELFGLHFNGASRDDGKWTIDFTSASPEKTDEDETEMVTDNLDEIYGKKKDKSRSSKRKSQTIHEMIKENKDLIYNKIKKMTGDNYAS